MKRKRKDVSAVLGPVPKRLTQGPRLVDSIRAEQERKANAPSRLPVHTHDYTRPPADVPHTTVRPEGFVKELELPAGKRRAAPLYSNKTNLDPTTNKRERKKETDAERKKLMDEENEKKRQEKMAMRNKAAARKSAREIEKHWAHQVAHRGFKLPPGFESPWLNATERKTYEGGRRDMMFYVTRIDQINTRIQREPPRVIQPEEEEEEKEEKDGKEDEEEEEEEEEDSDLERQRRRKRLKRKRRRQSDSEEEDNKRGESSSEEERVRYIARSRKRKSKSKKAPPKGDDEDGPVVKQGLVPATPSSWPWYDLKQDKATVEATLRLSGFMEQPLAQPTYDGETVPTECVPGVVYVHNFRSRFNAALPKEWYTEMGLAPRADFEYRVKEQFVDVNPTCTTSREDQEQTGLIDPYQRLLIRKWLSSYHKALERVTHEVLPTLKKKINIPCSPYILRVRLVWAASHDGFQNNCLYPHLEIQASLPQLVPTLRDIVQNRGVVVDFPWRPTAAALAHTPLPPVLIGIVGAYERGEVAHHQKRLCCPALECDIKYAEARFPADMELSGECWITLPASTYSLRPADERWTVGMRSDPPVPAVAEFDTSFRTIKVHSERARAATPVQPLPFNYKELLEATRNITWTIVPRLHPSQPELDIRLNVKPKISTPPAVPPPPGPNVSTGPPPTPLPQGTTGPPPPLPRPEPTEERQSSVKPVVRKPPDTKRIANYPVTVLDYEMITWDGKPRFPDASQDPIIMACIVRGTMGMRQAPADLTTCQALIVTTAKSSPLEGTPGCHVKYVENEMDLISYVAWAHTMIHPGMILTYNGDRFDWPYHLDRAIALDQPFAQYLSPIAEPLRIRERVQETIGGGARTISDITIPGVNDVDLLRVFQKELEKHTSYSLNNMAKHYLKREKAHVHHTDIPKLYKGTPDRVRRLVKYNIWDCLLGQQLFVGRKFHLNLPATARATGIQIQQLYDMGPGKQSMASFLIESSLFGLLRPWKERRNDKEKYTGATVLVPKTGLYWDPIVVMDFASLYPSIMIAFNLCVTTHLTKEQIDRLHIPPDQYHTIYSGRGGAPTYWAKPSLRQGVLPLQVQSFLAARKEAKKKKGEAVTLTEQDVYEAMQLAFKVRANSVYGLTKEMDEDLSRTVTYLGRKFIEEMKRVVEKEMVPENGYGPDQGYPQRPVVIYGDTDSIMCHFGPVSLTRAFEIGEVVQNLSKKVFRELKDVKLEFEKVYCPMMLSKKKKYAGLMFTMDNFRSMGTFDKLDKKGSEAVRSDSCKMQKEIMLDMYDMLLLGRLSPTSTMPTLLDRIRREHHLSLATGVRVGPRRTVGDMPAWLQMDKPTWSYAEAWADPASPYFTQPAAPMANPETFKKLDPDAQRALFFRNRDTFAKPLNRMLAHRRLEMAMDMVRLRASSLLQSEVDISKLVLSKSWRKRNYTGLNVAMAVAQKMAERDAGSAPSMGDRIAYLICRMPKGSKVAHSAEDPQHVLHTGKPIDLDHYLERQLRRPLCSMFLPILKTLFPNRVEFQQRLYVDPDDSDEEEEEEGEWEEEEKEEKEAFSAHALGDLWCEGTPTRVEGLTQHWMWFMKGRGHVLYSKAGLSTLLHHPLLLAAGLDVGNSNSAFVERCDKEPAVYVPGRVYIVKGPTPELRRPQFDLPPREFDSHLYCFRLQRTSGQQDWFSIVLPGKNEPMDPTVVSLRVQRLILLFMHMAPSNHRQPLCLGAQPFGLLGPCGPRCEKHSNDPISWETVVCPRLRDDDFPCTNMTLDMDPTAPVAPDWKRLYGVLYRPRMTQTERRAKLLAPGKVPKPILKYFSPMGKRKNAPASVCPPPKRVASGQTSVSSSVWVNKKKTEETKTLIVSSSQAHQAALATINVSKAPEKKDGSEMTKDDKKALKRTQDARFKKAKEAANAMIFKGIGLTRRAKSLDCEGTEAVQFWSAKRANTLCTQCKSRPPVDKSSLCAACGMAQPRAPGGPVDTSVPPAPIQPKPKDSLKRASCIQCKTMLKVGQEILCTECLEAQPRAPRGGIDAHAECHLYPCPTPTEPCFPTRFRSLQSIRHAQLRKDHETQWRMCYKCAESVDDAKRCQNNDCNYYYYRDTLTLDLEDLGRKMEKFPCVSPSLMVWLQARRRVVWMWSTRLDRLVEWVNTLGLKHVSPHQPRTEREWDTCTLEYTANEARTHSQRGGWFVVVADHAPTEQDLVGWRLPPRVVDMGPNVFWYRTSRVVEVMVDGRTQPLLMELDLCDGILSTFVRRRIEHWIDADASHKVDISLVPVEDRARIATLRKQEQSKPGFRFVQEAMTRDGLVWSNVAHVALRLTPVYVCAQEADAAPRWWKIRMGGVFSRLYTWMDQKQGGLQLLPLVYEYLAWDRNDLPTELVKRLGVSPTCALHVSPRAPKKVFVDTRVDFEIDWEDFPTQRVLRAAPALT